jgi:hypothetical protein
LSQNTFSWRFPTPSKSIASILKNPQVTLQASYNRVHSLVPSCGRVTFDLEINTKALAMRMLQKVEMHILVTNLTRIA